MALVQAILSPRDFDMNRVNAQETRRILDRVVGYEASPLLWQRFATGTLSAGRVQSASLKMIVERHKEIEQHQPVPYWTIDAKFQVLGTTIPTFAFEGSKRNNGTLYKNVLPFTRMFRAISILGRNRLLERIHHKSIGSFYDQYLSTRSLSTI